MVPCDVKVKPGSANNIFPLKKKLTVTKVTSRTSTHKDKILRGKKMVRGEIKKTKVGLNFDLEEVEIVSKMT